MFRKLSTFLFLILPILVQAQATTTLKFTEMDYSFGSVKEEGGLVKHVFYFTNTGTEPLNLVDVKGSCGCTIPTWNKQSVAPGKKDSIVVNFNPLNRPGNFKKEVYITANTTPASTKLTISGYVEQKQQTIAQQYPYAVGKTRFTADYVNIGVVPIKDPVTRELQVYNEGEAPISFVANPAYPAWVKVTVEPAQIPAKGKGVIKFTYDPKLRNDFGFFSDQIELITNEPVNNRKKILLSGNLTEYFPPVPADQIYNQPKASWVSTTKELGTMQPNSSVDFSYDVVNTGKQDLIIRSVKTTCGCTTAKAEKTVIKPGETGHILATFNSTGLTGVQQKAITVIVNDASGSQIVLYYKATISAGLAPAPLPTAPANGQ